jgi:parallel beta-helix repeat protein
MTMYSLEGLGQYSFFPLPEPKPINGSPIYSHLSSTSENTPHSPIWIMNDADFMTQAMNENWPGNGTKLDPFIIEGLAIIEPVDTILISIIDTTVYFEIRNCILSNGQEGIRLNHVSNGCLFNNTITNNFYRGVTLWRSSNCIISQQTVRDNVEGVDLRFIANTYVAGSTIDHNSGNGIYCQSPEDETHLTNNTISFNGGRGILLQGAQKTSGNIISSNIIYNNSMEGIYLTGSFNTIVQRNNVTNNSGHGITTQQYGYNYIAGNNIANNRQNGVYVEMSDNNFLFNNTVANNGGRGIYIGSSHENDVFGNKVTNNTGGGIYVEGFFEFSRSNLVSGNLIENNNNYGCYIALESGGSKIKRNNFHENRNTGESQAIDNGINNSFEFNYWSEWKAPDHDGNGIVDQVYPIEGEGNNSDSYPLVTAVHLVPCIISPTGGEVLNGIVLIEWAAIDFEGHNLRYDISYSADGGRTWILLVTNLTSSFYTWDTRSLNDGSKYLIQINASCTEGQWCALTSDEPFTIFNFVINNTSFSTSSQSRNTQLTRTPIFSLSLIELLGLGTILTFVCVVTFVIRRQQLN